MKASERIKKAIRTTKPLYDPVTPVLSSGIPLLNLACSGRPDVAFPLGSYVYFVGDSSSGKTFFCMEVLAQAAINPDLGKHTLVFDNAENGAYMDLNKFYPPLVGRLQPPRGTVKAPRHSKTLEEFYYNLENLLNAGPVIYVLDSMDALRSKAEDRKYEEDKAAHFKGSNAKGSYDMSKPKVNSSLMRRLPGALRDTNSQLFLISQTRDKIGTPFPMKTRSGGTTLKFFAHVELWTSVRGDLTRKVGVKERTIGSTIRIDVQKNRINGWDGKIEIPFYRSIGWDATGASVDFLVEEGHWVDSSKSEEDDEEKEGGEKKDKGKKKKGGKIEAPEFDFVGKREDLIKRIESEDGEQELTELTQKVWDEIEEGCRVERKSRY